MQFISETDIVCPHCGESFPLQIDTSQAEQTVIEDCSVCCRPITLEIEPSEPVFLRNLDYTAKVKVRRKEGENGPINVTVQTSQVAAQGKATSIEPAVEAFWAQRPDGVVAARVGYLEESGEIGDTPCIAVSVVPQAFEAVHTSGRERR